MSFKIECYSKWNVTQNGISLIRTVIQIEMSLKSECHLNGNVTQTGTEKLLFNIYCSTILGKIRYWIGNFEYFGDFWWFLDTFGEKFNIIGRFVDTFEFSDKKNWISG